MCFNFFKMKSFVLYFSFVLLAIHVNLSQTGCPVRSTTAHPLSTTTGPSWTSMEIIAQMVITNPLDLVIAILTDPANRTLEQIIMVENKTREISQMVIKVPVASLFT
jgi:hypothetical protein